MDSLSYLMIMSKSNHLLLYFGYKKPLFLLSYTVSSTTIAQNQLVINVAMVNNPRIDCFQTSQSIRYTF